MTNLPVIKYSGSKRYQTNEILKYFPKTINNYYEPFCGGASVLKGLLDNDININVNNYYCSDINNDLIQLFNIIKNTPEILYQHYSNLYTEFNSRDIQYRKEFFNKIRNKYNKEHNPLDYFFLTRTATNGMSRYNKKGEFNNSCHFTRPGISPNKLHSILFNWSETLKKYNVHFDCVDYTNIQPNKDDFLYLDPPYYNTRGMYFGVIDYNVFWSWLKTIKCNYLLSFDGISGNINNTYLDVPTDLYSKHIYIKSGNSSFKRMKNNKDSIVYDSLYIKVN